MKKWAWLLVLPYVVICVGDRCGVQDEGHEWFLTPGFRKETAEDAAESLNQAHERRMNPKVEWRDNTPPTLEVIDHATVNPVRKVSTACVTCKEWEPCK